MASIQWLRPFSRAAMVQQCGPEGELYVRLASLGCSLWLASWAAARLRRGGAPFAYRLGLFGAVGMGGLASLAWLRSPSTWQGWLLYLGVDAWSASWVALAWHQLGTGARHRGPALARAGLGGLLGGLLGGAAAASWAPKLSLPVGLSLVAVFSPWMGWLLASVAPLRSTASDGHGAARPMPPCDEPRIAGAGAWRGLVAVSVASEVLAQLLDYRAVSLAAAHLGTEEAVRAFFGWTAMGASALGVLAQLAWSRWAGGRRRAVLGLLVVPLGVSLLLFAASAWGASLLWAAGLVVWDRGLGHSVHQSAREQLIGQLAREPGSARFWASAVAPRLGRCLGVAFVLALPALGATSLLLSMGVAACSAAAAVWVGRRLVAASGAEAASRSERIPAGVRGWLVDSLRLPEPERVTPPVARGR